MLVNRELGALNMEGPLYFLIAGTLLFFGAHLYSAFRNRMPAHDIRRRLGSAAFMGAYSLIAGAGLVLMVWGYSLADPTTSVYVPPPWGRHVTLAIMLPAFILLIASYGPRGYIKNTVKHPMLLAVILWSGSHLAANGELRSAILFGGFFVYGIIDRLAVMNRPTQVKRVSVVGDLIALVVGAALYYIFLKYLHASWIGTEIMGVL